MSGTMNSLMELLAERRQKFEFLVVNRQPVEVLEARNKETLELIQAKKRNLTEAEKEELIALWNKEPAHVGKPTEIIPRTNSGPALTGDKIYGIEDEGIIPDSAGNGTSGANGLTDCCGSAT